MLGQGVRWGAGAGQDAMWGLWDLGPGGQVLGAGQRLQM